MNEMQVFQNSEFGELGVLEVNGKPYFPATACAKKLGYANPQKAIRDHCKGVNEMVTPTKGGTQTMRFIPEGDLYRLIVHSKLPAAERFEKWVFDEVLPTIRRAGGYGQIDMATVTQIATIVAAEMVKQLVLLLQTAQSAARPKPGFFAPANSLKLETFPPEIIQEVDGMREEMVQQQALNFSMIARSCTMNGYTISSPSVKRYFDRLFNQD